MMLFNSEVCPSIKEGSVEGRQGGGREVMRIMKEIMRDNEYNSKTKQNKKMDLRNVK
jgi:hypothetical protein